MRIHKGIQDLTVKKPVEIAIDCDPEQEVVIFRVGAECIGLPWEHACLMEEQLILALEAIHRRRRQRREGRVQ